MNLQILDSLYAVCKISVADAIPDWANGDLISLTVTGEECSLVTRQQCVPDDVQCQRDWRVFRICGTLNFSLTGIISGISGILADARIPVFVVSTFDTDFFLVPDQHVEIARRMLVDRGYRFIG